MIQRRSFLTLLGGATAAWPLAARAQQQGLPIVGYIGAGAPEQSMSRTAAFRKGLSETGHVEGRNVLVEYRWGQNDSTLLSELAADLVRRRVAVIATPGSGLAAVAARAASSTVPIVFLMGGDPVQAGLVASFNRPVAKRLAFLHELVPNATKIAAVHNVSGSAPGVAATITDELQRAASALGRDIEIIDVSTNREIDAVFANFATDRVGAVWFGPSLLFSNRRIQLAALAMRYAIPAIYSDRSFAEARGLMSYGTDVTDQHRQVGIYVGRFLKGEKPADLPIMRATKFELVINLHTAKLLNVTVPGTLLALADEVIE